MDDNLKKTRIETFVLFVLYMFILPRVAMEYDMGFWRDWAVIIHRQGLGNAYNTSINYFPIYLYGLYLYDLLQGTEAHIIANINNIKILFVCFDFLPLVLLCCFRKKILNYNIPHLFLLLNIAYLFNSMVWGQIDSIYTNLSFLAIITSLINPVIGILLYLLALNTKAQAIEFLPIMFIVLFYSIKKVKTIFIAAGGAIVAQFLILIPFMGNGGVTKLWNHALNSVDLYSNLSISAFNIWYLITNINPYLVNAKDVYFLFSYQTFGLLFFIIASLLILIPVFRNMWQQKREQQLPNDTTYQTLFLGTGLLCLYFFYFNTQMHERYVHPIIIFFFFYGVVSKNYKLYILASIPYLLSLDKCFSYPDGYLPIVHYKFIYASKIIALWYSLTVIYGSVLFYKLVKSKV